MTLAVKVELNPYNQPNLLTFGDWLTDCMVFNTVFNTIYILVGRAPIHALVELLFKSTAHNILCKPLAAFPHDHYWNNPVPNTTSIINLRKQICHVWNQTSDLLFASWVCF